MSTIIMRNNLNDKRKMHRTGIDYHLECMHSCSKLRFSFAGLKLVLSGTKSSKVLLVKSDYIPVSLLSTCFQILYK